jgi:hypothetical protein
MLGLNLRMDVLASGWSLESREVVLTGMKRLLCGHSSGLVGCELLGRMLLH